jgi:hypothetical protein
MKTENNTLYEVSVHLGYLKTAKKQWWQMWDFSLDLKPLFYFKVHGCFAIARNLWIPNFCFIGFKI